MTVQANQHNLSGANLILKILLLALIPVVLAGAFLLGARIHARFRYDETYFSAAYQQQYASPGSVAIALEQALQQGDSQLYAELTGMQREFTLEAYPELAYMLLVEVDQADYFHYLYFDFDTFHRQTHYIKEQNQRWIAVPEDVYFYFDSGQWLRVFFPLALTWWVFLLAFSIIKGLSHLGARTRSAYGF